MQANKTLEDIAHQGSTTRATINPTSNHKPPTWEALPLQKPERWLPPPNLRMTKTKDGATLELSLIELLTDIY